MEDIKTPVKSKTNNVLNIPASPMLQHLGYGTGVEVYRLNRSPQCGKVNSPWALKYLTRRKLEQADCANIERRLNDEADILRKLEHPNVVGFRAFTALPDGRKVLAMEDCAISLGTLIEIRNENEGTLFEAKNILKMIFDMACALDYLHQEALLMHGDVKSSNVLVKGNFDICKICDFGVSIPVDKNGRVLPNYYYHGTELWSPPEVINDCEVTCKADLFALGLTAWEMLSLHAPHIPPIDESAISSVDVEESFDDFQINFGKRPDLPDINYTDDYYPVLESFYILTEHEAKDRPSASLLKELLKKKIV